MALIDQLLVVATPPIALSELPSDLIEKPAVYTPGRLCLSCRLCGATSGASLVLTHRFHCRYAPKRAMAGPFIFGARRRATTALPPDACEAILQHELGVVAPGHAKTVLATYAAGPCVIVAMYDRSARRAGLAQVDALTRDPIHAFDAFPLDSEVLVVGGDNHSRATLLATLQALRAHGYGVAFAHVLDAHSNRLAIDCATGEVWLNDEVEWSSVQVSVDKELRERMLVARALSPGPLALVPIPTRPVDSGTAGR